MTKRINTHELLKEYHSRRGYPEIAKYAASLTGELGNDPEQILEAVEKKFGKDTSPAYRDVPVPIATFGKVGALIPKNAYDQMEVCARIPPAIRAALMPDAHKGYGLPIGGVIETENAISPGYIGFDISCMVMLSVYDIPPNAFISRRKMFADYLKASTKFGVGLEFDSPRKHAVMDNEQWNIAPKVKALQYLANRQLGTSGGGNHFADIVLISRIRANVSPEFLPMDHRVKRIGLLTHSGSRGTGHKLATHYTKMAENETKATTRNVPKGHGWLRMDTDAGKEYWEVMQLMGEYALANHEIIHSTFARSSGLQVAGTIFNRHNYAWLNSKGNYVHRKGATPAHKDEIGLIPGTSGSPSYLTSGLGNPEALFSSAHGAGRPYSRTEAKRVHSEAKFKKHMEDKNISYHGVASDETIQAYKDIEDVMAIQDGLLINRVARLEPQVVIMGGRADDGD
ncbi:hypothetical protein LCGC14_1108650 [marine sediment metagenome]|uniref:3'-phosphate/5'-hydroxy nucleic acid ligase n=1 Tax=marine sediment metagenome TaxID=412755 RepID=A0A0F9MC67_9ZZZZ